MRVTARVRALSVGRAGTVGQPGREIRSAFCKTSTRDPLRLRELGFDGDEHVYEFHGGPDKAVLAYSYEHYPFWMEQYGLDLPSSSAFGENLTIEGLTERSAHLGDVYEVGSAVIQVTQPRAPCFKIGARYGVPRMTLYVQQHGFTGILFRVLEEGEVRAGDTLQLRSRLDHGITVAAANEILNINRRDLDGARLLLSTPNLPTWVTEDLVRRLEVGGQGEDSERLYGQ